MTETTTEAKPEAKPRKLIPISQSISVLPTDTARIYNYIHPILILSLYYLCFPSLVADPVSTLKKSIAPLAHLQIIYCIVCLPPSKGSSTQSTPSTPSTTPKKKKVQFAKPAAKPPANLASRIIVSSLCFHPFYLLHIVYQLAKLIFLHLARHPLPPAFPLPLSATADGHPDPLWRPSDYTLLAQSTLRNAHIVIGCPAFVLRTWGRRAHVEGDIWSLPPFRRGLGRHGRRGGRSLAWCCMICPLKQSVSSRSGY